MTRKDYQLIAEVCSATKPFKPGAAFRQWRSMVATLADRLGVENPHFQPLKFFKACGYEVTP